MAVVDLSAKWTVRGVAAVLGADPAAVQKLANRGVFDGCGTLGEAVQAAWKDRSEAAAGRGGDDQAELTRQRARQAAADADLKELQYAQATGELVSISELEPRLTSLVLAMRTELLSANQRQFAHIESQHGLNLDRETLDAIMHAALRSMASLPRVAGQDGGEDMGADTAAAAVEYA